MRKLFLILLMIIGFVVTGISQSISPQQPGYVQQQNYYVPNPDQIATINITLNQVQNGWARMGTVCAGCPSYWCQILRSQQMIQAEDGSYYYYYFFKFYSNSFYTDGSPASTYLSQVNFYLNGDFIFTVPYILCPSGQVVWGAWMRSINGNAAASYVANSMNVH